MEAGPGQHTSPILPLHPQSRRQQDYDCGQSTPAVPTASLRPLDLLVPAARLELTKARTDIDSTFVAYELALATEGVMTLALALTLQSDPQLGDQLLMATRAAES